MKTKLDTRIEIKIVSHAICLACESEITEGYPVIGGMICEPCAKNGTKFSLEMPDGSILKTNSTSWVNGMHYE